MVNVVPIQCLAPGDLAVIRMIDGDPEDLRRLAELGLRRGVEVRMIQPGSPCIARVGNRDICLRLGDSVHVLAQMKEAA